MTLPPEPVFAAALGVAGLLCLLVAAVVAQRRRAAAGAVPLAVLLLAMAWWDLTYAAYWAAAPAPVPTFWLDATYLGVVAVPAAFLLFAARVTGAGRSWGRGVLLALAVEPVLVLALLWSPLGHTLFFAGHRDPAEGFIRGGPGYLLNLVYAYALVAVGTAMVVARFRPTTGLYRRQMASVMLGVAVPWVSSAALALDIHPLGNADITPFSFSVVAVLFADVMVRGRLLDVAPVARHVLVEHMADAVVVLDAADRLVDLNPAAAELLGEQAHRGLGQPAATALAAVPELVEVLAGCASGRMSVALQGPQPRSLDVQVVGLGGADAPMGRLVVVRDVSELTRLQRELALLATTDELTGLCNRREFLLRAAAAVRRGARDGCPLSLVMLDLDDFKAVNDTLGHAAGDRALVAFADACVQLTRPDDLLARMGGDEFVLLLPGADEFVALDVTSRLQRALAGRGPGAGPPVRFSAGVAGLAGPQDTLDELLVRADRALYAAKRAGRDRTALSVER